MGFLDLSRHINRPGRASHHLGGCNGFIRTFPHINRLARASHDTTVAFLTHKQACTGLTGPQKGSKLLSRDFLVLKQPCTCFTPPPWRLKRLYQDVPAHKQACTSFTGLHSRENCFLDLSWHETELHTLYSTSSTDKTALSGLFRAHKQACTSFTGPPQ